MNLFPLSSLASLANEMARCFRNAGFKVSPELPQDIQSFDDIEKLRLVDAEGVDCGSLKEAVLNGLVYAVARQMCQRDDSCRE